MAIDEFLLKTPSGRGVLSAPLEARVARGTTDIDDSAQTETTASVILTITAPTASGVQDVEVWFDLHLATTGFGTVEDTATAKFLAARAVDATNYRTGPDANVSTTAISGTSAAADAGQAAVVKIGDIPAGETVKVYVDTSADVTSDIELPYAVFYKGRAAVTVTPVVAD